MSNLDMIMTSSVYLAVLKKDVPSPLAPESDEEKGVSKEEAKKEDPKKPESKIKEPIKEKSYSIDFEGLIARIISLPLPAAPYINLQAGSEGQIYYLELPKKSWIFFALGREEGGKLHKFDLKTKKDEVLAENIDSYLLSADNQKILYRTKNSVGIVPAGKIQPGQGKLNTDAIEILIHPQAEWKQIYNEAWRLNRDSFYDPNMHGANLE